MVQIKVSDLQKEKNTPESESLTTVTSTTPSVLPEIRAVRVSPRNERSSRPTRALNLLLFFLLGIVFLATVKRLCDYKEENLRLMQELAYERQKDAVLKQTVRSSVPEAVFAVVSRAPASQFEEFGGEVSRGWFSVDLMVLWRTVEIVRCDTEDLSQQLTREIYTDTQSCSSALLQELQLLLSSAVLTTEYES